uniref:G-protein coupled receptors family 1 profile domain-containing protein n=1 Tax=Cavia porcellus TaxID=10141 RepID=A0A286XAZ8_CAVPO
ILRNLFIIILLITDSHTFIFTFTFTMILDILSKCKLISFQVCMKQICFIHIMGGVEMVLLIAMAFDRYIAICKPLHYLSIMSPKRCVSFVALSWVGGVVHAMSQLYFVINFFYCEFPRIIKLACTNGAKFEFVVAANNGFMSPWPPSSWDLYKALITLSAHITVIVLSFTPCMFLYVWPFTTLSGDKYLFIIYFTLTPILNPLICTLRNRDMKIAIKSLSKKIYCVRSF